MAEQLISTSVHHTLPDSYVRNEAERPRLHEVVLDANIPVVDLAYPDRAAVISQIGATCRSHGFFQVLNHGLPVEFFRLSPEEKAKLYSDDPSKKMRLSTSLNVRKETVHNWRDCDGASRSSSSSRTVLPIYCPSGTSQLEHLMKRNKGTALFLRPEPANIDRLLEAAANVNTSTELPQEEAVSVNVTLPESPPEVAANDDVTSLGSEVGTIWKVVHSLIPRASPTRGQLVTSLFLVSSFTALFGLTAVFHLPAAGPVFGHYNDGYYTILAIILAAAAVEQATAYWLAFSDGRLILALAKVVLPLAYLILLVVVALGGFVIPFREVHRVG